MPIKADAFVALEVSLTNKLQKSLRKLTTALYKQVDISISNGDFQEAERLVNSLSLSSIGESNKEYMAYMTDLAMLFGASRVTPNPGTSVVGLGYEKMMAQQAVQSLTTMVVQRAEFYVKNTAMQLIAQARLDPQEVKKADRPRNQKPFAVFMNDAGDAYLDLVASLHTSRVSAYGYTAEALALGYEEYQINEQLDARTCPVCAQMHGKKFRVSDARSLLEVALSVDNPDDLRSIQPWPSQNKASVAAIGKMSNEELVANRWHVPPFHPGCRGLLGRVGKVPTVEQIASGTADKGYTATREDFKALGVSFTSKAVAMWNKYSKISPLEFSARLQGTTEDELAARLLKSKKPVWSGILGMSASKNISLRMERIGFGTNLPFYQNIQIKPSLNALYINAVELDAIDQASGMLKKYMRALVSVTRDMGLGAIYLTAGLEVGGYAWAKYGFSPSEASWEALKVVIDQRISDGALKGVSASTQAVVSALLASNDPDSIFILADLTEKTVNGVPVGKELLLGTEWSGSLELDDQVSMGRFLSYLGGEK